MNVRKMSATSLSIIVLLAIFIWLFTVVQDTLPSGTWNTLVNRVTSFSHIGAYHSAMFKLALWLMIIVGFIDAVLQNKIALSVLASFKILFILAIPAVLFAFIPIGSFFFWGVMYVIVILGIYFSFQELISNNHPVKKNLITFLRDIPAHLALGNDNIWNRYTVVIGSVFLVVFLLLLIISFTVYLLVNWEMFI